VKFKRETEFQDTEIGKIPKEWKIEKLGRMVKYVKGKKPSVLFNERPSEEFIPYLTAEYMRGLDRPKWCNPKLEGNIIRVSRDDIIMIWDGSYAGHVFTGFNGVLASTMVKITPIVELDKKFLYYYLLANYEKFRSTTVGTGIPHVNKKVFEEFPIPVPPIHEQKRIAEILSTVDRVIESVDVAIARLEGLKKALMRELLTGRIRVREENGKLVFHRETEFQDTEIGRIPKEWKIVKLKDIVEPRKEIVDPTQVDPSTPYVGLEHVDSGSIKLERYGKAGNVKSAKLRFYKDDILYGKLRPYLDKAVIAHFDGVCSTDFIVMKTRHSVKPEYLIWVLHTNEFIKYATQTMKGTNHPRTSWESLANYTLCLPPINEQELIACVLNITVRLKGLYIREKAGLERLKRGLMGLLLTGKVRVVE
jgi:type I restriction enzyme S subunit